MSDAIHPGELVNLSPLVRRLTADNPSVFTGPGTNTYLVGHREITVIDPGPAMPAHVENILHACDGKLTRILVTHTHRDHSPAVALLQQQCPAPALGRVVASGIGPQDDSFRPDEEPQDGALCGDTEYRLRAIHTPGHASNHLCFLLENEQMLFTGDHIMSGSTVVIAPPDGNMSQYLDSLQRLHQFAISTLAPAHGGLIKNPREAIDGLIAHRLKREDKVRQALRTQQSSTVQELVPPVYDDVDSRLHPIAAQSLLAHLLRLQELGEARGDDQHVWHST